MNRFTSFACLFAALLTCSAAVSQPSGKPPNAVIPPNPFPEAVSVPPGIFEGGTEWLNTSGPIDIKDLRGKVVLLDFWTYCCINCIHVIPDLKYLEEKYKNELVVIGVHSAKFDNEKLSANIRDAILRYEIKHPVVNDSEMVIWRKFGTRSWPTLALIDPEGKFAGSQGGEGNRELFDVVISRLIEHHRAKGTLNETPIEFELEEGKAEPTPLRYPGKLLADAASNRLFISDSNHNRIVITDLNGLLLDVVGTGLIGKSDGDYSTATFDHPQGMALVDETLYVADTENHLIRAVSLSTKLVSTLAGTGRQGRPGDVDGDISKTNLNSPWDLCHANGTLFIAMAGPHQIWSHKIGSSNITIHAGNAREDVINGRLDLSAFAQPSGLSLDGTGQTFYVADSEGSAIRQVSVGSPGKVATIAGTSELPRGQSLFAFGDVDGVGADARFQHPLGVAWHDGFVYVADTYNHKIKKVEVATGATQTWLGTGKAGKSDTELNEPSGLSIAEGKLYIADTNNHRILVADLQTSQTSEIQLSGVTPPSPPKTTRILPNMANATDVSEQKVALNDSVTVTVDLAIPADHKLNTLAPVSCRVFLIEGDQILADAATAEGVEVTTNKTDGTFSLPLAKISGTATVGIEMSYGYCGIADSDVCKLANALWKFSIVVSEDATASEIKLAFPQTDAADAGN
ncbi:MAG: thioredoxin-like domain-containing protein [Fuerstiella sp.]